MKATNKYLVRRKMGDGGKTNNIGEVTVYGKEGYNKALKAIQDKYLEDMSKYKKDSIEWSIANKANQAYQDSLQLYNVTNNIYNTSIEMQKIHDQVSKNKSISPEELKRYIELNNNLSKNESIYKKTFPSYFDDNNKRKNKYLDKRTFEFKMVEGDIQNDPILNSGASERIGDAWAPSYKKPIKKPIIPTIPFKPTLQKINYDPTYENLNLTNGWPFIAKQDSAARIGTLNGNQFSKDSRGMAGTNPIGNDKGFNISDAHNFPQEIKDKYNIDMIYNQVKNKKRLGGYDKGRMQGTEYGQIGVSMGQGALTGATIGSAIPVIGTAIGAVIGGAAGLVGGIFKGKSAATARAQANNMANEKILTAINGKRDTDSSTLGLSKSFNPTTEFYAALGGRVPRTQYAKGGLIPISSTVDAVFGPTHNQSDGQGGTGVSISPNTEVEGGGNGKRGEVLIHTVKDTKVISNSLRVPGTNLTYADIANHLGEQQGQYEHKLINTEDMLDTTMKLLDKTRYNPTRGTMQRNAQKLAFRSKQLANMVDLKYNQVNGVFEEQEAMKDRMGINDIGKTQFGGGGSIDAGKLQMGVNTGSTILQGIGNAFTLMQMNKIKTPKQALLESTKFNANFDISNQLDEINSTAGQSMKYIGDNTSNSNIARQQMSSILLNKGRSKNALFAQQANAQNTIFNQNIENDSKTKAANNEISYNNESVAFNRSMDTYSKISQMIAQATQGAQDAAGQYAQYQNQTDQMRMYAAMAPKGVNRDLIGKLMWERLYGKGSWDKSSTNLGIRAEQDVSEFTGKYGGRVPLARKGRLKVA